MTVRMIPRLTWSRHVDLSEIWNSLGQTLKAAAELEKAADLAEICFGVDDGLCLQLRREVEERMGSRDGASDSSE